MSIDAKGEITVSRPRSEVAEVMFNPKFDKVWISGVKNSFPLTPGLLEKGSRVERVADFLNKSFSTVFEVVSSKPGELVEMTADEPFQLKVRYELADAGADGTLVRIKMQSVGDTPFKMPAPVLARSVSEMISRDLKRLKKLVEDMQAG